MPRDTGGVVGLAPVLQQQPLSWMPPEAYVNYAMGPPDISFSFRVEPLTSLCIYVGVCSGVCFLLSGDMFDGISSNWVSTTGDSTTEAL